MTNFSTFIKLKIFLVSAFSSVRTKDGMIFRLHKLTAVTQPTHPTGSNKTIQTSTFLLTGWMLQLVPVIGSLTHAKSSI